MTGKNLLDLMRKANRRSHLIGNQDNGIVAALDLEGRLFTIINARVLNRVVPSAILNRSNKALYLNPGGDVLWPAPEGTCLGYEYSTGNWRVPPSITGAVWEVVSYTPDKAFIRAEIDLINNRQLGIPCEFERHIELVEGVNSLTQHVTEVIRYIGKKSLKNGEFSLAPWSLCQFDSVTNGKVVMPPPLNEEIWDMYEPSETHRWFGDDLFVVDTNTQKRFQLGISANVSWIEYICGNLFKAKRYADNPPKGQYYIDIADASPEQLPSARGVKFSVYCDPSGFMEIEACGGCTADLNPGTELIVKITNEYVINTGD
jgi:hypothetical protein